MNGQRTIYLNNASTFRAAAENLPKPLDSTELCISLRKSNDNWVFVPPYAPSQNRRSKRMVKLFNEPVRQKPSLFSFRLFSDIVKIMNNCPLTALSD